MSNYVINSVYIRLFETTYVETLFLGNHKEMTLVLEKNYAFMRSYIWTYLIKTSWTILSQHVYL